MSATHQVTTPSVTPSIPAPAGSETTSDPATLLQQARSAWRQKLSAESTLARLSRYTRMTPGMKMDANHASSVLRNADSTLIRILG